MGWYSGFEVWLDFLEVDLVLLNIIYYVFNLISKLLDYVIFY